jgi:hypothetical protein
MLVDTVRTLRHLPASGVLTVCAFILVAAGARTGVWQRTWQQAAGAKRATNEWERTAFLLKDAAVNAVVFGLSTTVVIVWAHRWLIVLGLVMGAVLVVPTVLQDLRLTFGGALSIFSMRAQRTATAASIVMRLLGDLVQVFYVALLLTALVT